MTEYLKLSDLTPTRASTIVEVEGEEAIAEAGSLIATLLLLG